MPASPLSRATQSAVPAPFPVLATPVPAAADLSCVTLTISNLDGHRSEYLEFFARLLQTKRVAPTPPRLLDVLGREPVLFLTIEDHLATFLRAAVLRSVLGRRTAGLFLRPNECFRPGLKYRLKYAVFRCASRLPLVSVTTILPFYVNERFAEVATDWIDDPQCWDLLDAPPQEISCPLADEVRRAAGGREIVVALGGQNRIKGFDFFAQLWAREPRLRERYFFCVAGAAHPGSRESANSLVREGAFLCDRHIETHELFALYRAADLVWSCYAPDYDQASGIFGRALQLGVPSIVREGSFLQKIGPKFSHVTLALPFGCAQTSADRLLSWKREAASPDPRASVVAARSHALAVLSQSLLSPGAKDRLA